MLLLSHSLAVTLSLTPNDAQALYFCFDWRHWKSFRHRVHGVKNLNRNLINSNICFFRHVINVTNQNKKHLKVLSCSYKSPESRCVSLCSMHKGCLLMGDDSNSLSRPPSLSFYVSLGSLKTPHTHTQMRHQNYYTTNCLASSAVWRNRMLWVVKRENRFRVLFPP